MDKTFRIEIPIHVDDNTDPGVTEAAKKINGFDRANEKAQRRLDQMNRTRYQVVLDALDRASGVVGRVTARVRNLAGRTYSFFVKAVDLATRPFRAIFAGLNSMLGMVGAGIGVAGGIVLPLKLTMERQNVETAFEVLLGSTEAAKRRVDELTTFAGQTPFARDEIFEASRVMQVFTGDALSTGEGLRLVGDIAAGTQQQFGEVALWMGRLYDAMQSGKPVGAMTSRLQEMGAIGGEARDRIEKLADSGLDISKTWPKATEEFARFDGMMGKLSGNLSNLFLGVKSFFTNNILLRWGQGMTTAITPALQAFREWRQTHTDEIARLGDMVQGAADRFAGYFVDKVQGMTRTLRSLWDDDAFQKADLAEKFKLAWDKIIAEPFSTWWESTGKAWFAGAAGKVGKGIGAGITAGLLALLGFDAVGAAADGVSIGASFASGFVEGFDGKQVGEAILNAIKGIFRDAGTLFPGGEKATGTSWLSAGVVGLVAAKMGGGKLLGKLGGGIFDRLKGSRAGGALLDRIGKGSKAPLMTTTGGTGGGLGDLLPAGAMHVSASAVYLSGPLMGDVGAPRLPGGTPTTLPPATGAVGAGALTSTTAALANTGYVLGSGAATVGGAAMVGGASIAGIIGGVLGIGSGLYDIYKGITSDDRKEAKDRYFSGGSKIGMVGAGAAAGAGIGSLFGGIGAVPGALIGAGIGGAGALLSGSKAGQALSDATDPDGWLTEGWEKAKDIAVSAVNIIAGASGEARDYMLDKWSPVADWFDEKVWGPVRGAAGVAGDWIIAQWEEAKARIAEVWNPVADWLNSAVWDPVKDDVGTAQAWVQDQFTTARTAIYDTWATVSTWFEGTVWGPIKAGASAARGWIDEKLAGASQWLGGLGEKGSKDTGLTTSMQKGSILEHAHGGIMTKPHMGMVAEEGAEGIIPLSPSKRARGIDLWQRSGEMLGVQRYARGGIPGGEQKATPVSVAAPAPTGGAGQTVNVKVEVKAEPRFTIEGGGGMDEAKVVGVLKDYIREMADDIGDEVAERLARVFANMPTKGAGA